MVSSKILQQLPVDNLLSLGVLASGRQRTAVACPAVPVHTPPPRQTSCLPRYSAGSGSYPNPVTRVLAWSWIRLQIPGPVRSLCPALNRYRYASSRRTNTRYETFHRSVRGSPCLRLTCVLPKSSANAICAAQVSWLPVDSYYGRPSGSNITSKSLEEFKITPRRLLYNS
jgi:hypothetical protein